MNINLEVLPNLIQSPTQCPPISQWESARVQAGSSRSGSCPPSWSGRGGRAGPQPLPHSDPSHKWCMAQRMSWTLKESTSTFPWRGAKRVMGSGLKSPLCLCKWINKQLLEHHQPHFTWQNSIPKGEVASLQSHNKTTCAAGGGKWVCDFWFRA